MATYWENSCSFGLGYVSWYKYLIVSLVFSHLGFWSGNLFLIAPFPDLCLLVPFCLEERKHGRSTGLAPIYLQSNIHGTFALITDTTCQRRIDKIDLCHAVFMNDKNES